MSLSFLQDEKHRHLLCRHYEISGLNGEREIVTDIVGYVLAFHRNPWHALSLFERAVGYRTSVERVRPNLETFFLARYRNEHEYLAPQADAHYFIKNEQVFYYPYYWVVTLLDGKMVKGIFDALRWYLSVHLPPQSRKKRHQGSGRRYVSGSYRRPATTAERRAADAHAQEYGEGVVRPIRRQGALPTVCDRLYWKQQRCWKAQRKTAKQYQRQR